MSDAATFKLQILQNDIDLSGTISADGIRVRATVRAARTCAYIYTVAGPGSIDPQSLIGVPVVISVDIGGGMTPIFTGRISRSPTFDPFARTMTVEATDSWQEFLDAKTLPELQALVPNGIYREALDGKRVSGLQQMQALLSTVTQDAFLDRTGAWQLTDWQPKADGSEDGAVDASVIGTPVVRMTPADQLINRVDVAYRHTFTRRIWYRVSFSWQFGPGPGFARWPSWCDWYQQSGHELPIRTMIAEAAGSTNWLPIGGITMRGHPATFGSPGEPALCGAGVAWLLTDYFRTEVIEASWFGGQQFSVEAREELTLQVSSASSIGAFGEHRGELSFDDVTDYPADALDADQNPNRPENFTDYGGGGNQAYRDEIDPAQRTDNIRAVLAKARVKIWGSHRGNNVSWTQLCTPGAELGQTWKLTHPVVIAKGTLVELQHTITREAALTTLTVAAWVGGGGTDDPLTEPPVATSPPSEVAPSDVFLENKLGGREESPDYDPAWEQQSNWIANHPVVTQNPNKIYPVRLVVVPPDITADMRKKVDFPASQAYAVALPATSLSISG